MSLMRMHEAITNQRSFLRLKNLLLLVTEPHATIILILWVDGIQRTEEEDLACCGTDWVSYSSNIDMTTATVEDG